MEYNAGLSTFRVLVCIPINQKWNSSMYRTFWRVHLYQVWLLCWSGIRLIVSAVFLHAGKTYFCLSQHPLAVRPDELQ